MRVGAGKLAVLGAGSRTPLLLRGLVQRSEDLPIDEVILHDSDPGRLEIMTWFGRGLCESWGARFRVRSAAEPRDALSRARFVMAAIRVGGDEGRVRDERIALEHGVLGQETTGPGGFAMAMRTIPAMLEYARLIEEVAPDALVINFTNPAGLITQALHDHSSVRAVGICDTPIAAGRSLARFLGVPEVRLDYGGLNHLGWIRGVQADGRERLPELLERYEELAAGDVMWAMFDPELARSLAMLPNEYLHYYYSRRAVLARIRATSATRGEQVLDLNREMWIELEKAAGADDLDAATEAHRRAIETREWTYMVDESGLQPPPRIASEGPGFEGSGYEGLAAAVMVAAIRGHGEPLILNVPAADVVEGVDPGDVVETPCLFEEGIPKPLTAERFPDAARSLIAPVKAFEHLTVAAARTGSTRDAVAALVAHPLVGDHSVAASLAEAYLRADETAPNPVGAGGGPMV